MQGSNTSCVPMNNRRVRNDEFSFEELNNERRSKDKSSIAQQQKKTRKGVEQLKNKY